MLCFAIDCNHKNGKNPCSFYRFPSDKNKYTLWKKMSRRSDRNPDQNDRLCSCHFVDGKKSSDPSIFSYNEGKRFQYQSPEKRRRLNKSFNGNNVEDEENTVDDGTEITNVGEATSKNASLHAEIYFLKKEIEELKETVKKQTTTFQFSSIKEKDSHVLMYTGLPNASSFQMVLDYIARFDIEYAFGWKVESIPLEEQLFITLQKLRQNYKFEDLAVRYSVSDTTIRNIFHTFLSVIHEALFVAVIQSKSVPSLNKVKKTQPKGCDFENCRFVIDSTEIYIENPRSDLEAQRQTYSHYKKRQTFKGLLGVTPNGVICYASKLYPGSISDKELFRESGLIKILQPGELLLADKGFVIHDMLPMGVSLNIPPFLLNPKFTDEESTFTTKLARKRIHVERAIQRIKNFEILDLIPHQFHDEASIIFQVCATLVNLQNPLIKD